MRSEYVSLVREVRVRVASGRMIVGKIEEVEGDIHRDDLGYIHAVEVLKIRNGGNLPDQLFNGAIRRARKVGHRKVALHPRGIRVFSCLKCRENFLLLVSWNTVFAHT